MRGARCITPKCCSGLPPTKQSLRSIFKSTDVTRSPQRAEKTGPSEPALPEYPELSVIQMLADPIVRALMIADGVRVSEL